MLIAKQDDMDIDETVLYNQLVAWAEATLQRYCNPANWPAFLRCFSNGEEVTHTAIRDTLGEALYLVRFALMKVEDFANGPAKSGLLTVEVILTGGSVIRSTVPALGLPKHFPLVLPERRTAGKVCHAIAMSWCHAAQGNLQATSASAAEGLPAPATGITCLETTEKSSLRRGSIREASR